MKWFEPIIIIIAISLVVIPFALEIKKAITGKGTCACGCGGCNKKDKCLVNFKSYVCSCKDKNLKHSSFKK